MEYSYHEMEKTNIKYLIQWMTETQNCENIKVDNQESRITWHQNFLPGIWSISISSSSFMDKTQ